MSGTTGVIALIRDGTAHVANLGDSRAIIGWWTDAGEIEGEAISEDHVPSRKDEYERVREAGARIMTGSQLAGRAAWHNSWEEDVLGQARTLITP